MADALGNQTSTSPRSFGRDHLPQALGCILLDADDEFSITAVGRYRVRHEWRHVVTLELVPQLTGRRDLSDLRESFWQAVSRPCVHSPPLYAHSKPKPSVRLPGSLVIARSPPNI